MRKNKGYGLFSMIVCSFISLLIGAGAGFLFGNYRKGLCFRCKSRVQREKDLHDDLQMELNELR